MILTNHSSDSNRIDLFGSFHQYSQDRFAKYPTRQQQTKQATWNLQMTSPFSANRKFVPLAYIVQYIYQTNSYDDQKRLKITMQTSF